ncbi:MAG: efflux RND transporter periplasmic adaptor subunit [Lachnospiraceae bacterium]|jgi:HlyD family secretion protein|nr:efflux RND transporter periplasmic adaptor subunit [Lachnospiraceae bacterium]MCI1727596.1 efflux RND transporter periplasmic adaptor subunit [Lachnospiraceae bacterium]
MKKKVVIGVILAAAAIAAAFFVYRHFTGTSSSGTPTVYVNKVSLIMSQMNGTTDKFAGVVEPQETWDVKLQEGKTVKEVLVKEGDEVQAGTPLFTYDTAQAETDLAQAQLDSEKLDNDISNYNAQVAELTAERDKASDDAKLNYTTQISEAQMNIKKAEYDKKSKTAQIEKLQTAISGATVTSQIAGIVKSVASTDSSSTDSSGTAFISILTTGELRVKGTVNEQNVSSVTEGQKVIIRSRVDSAKTWTGTMGKVDTQASVNSGSNNMMYNGGTTDSASTSTNYPFYVALDSSDGLMLGQHVYIEPDSGQDAVKTGLWLSEYFIADIDSSPYVWADDGAGKLVKKPVVLGAHDENLMEYEITGGLTEDDEITYPEDTLTEGMTTGLGSNGEMGLTSSGDSASGEADMMSGEESILTDGGTAAGDTGVAADGGTAAGDTAAMADSASAGES